MAEEAKPKNVHQRIAAITAAVGAVEKTGKNKEQGYEFISYENVTASLRSLMEKHGVTVLQNVKDGGRHETEITNKYGTKGVHLLVDYEFTVTNVDDPQDKLTFLWQGEAMDYGDKATNKAATGAEKYFLMKLFKIGSKDDPDRETPDQAQATSSHAKSSAPPTAMTTKEILTATGKVLVDKGFSRSEALQVMAGIAGVDDASQLTGNKLRAVLDIAQHTDSEALGRYLPLDREVLDHIGPPETDNLPAPAGEPEFTYVVPEFKKGNSIMVRPEMTKLYKQWLEEAGLVDSADIATFVNTVIGGNAPITFNDYQLVLGALAKRLNEQVEQ